MRIDIKIDKPDWDPNPWKTTTNNYNWRKCVIVQFENQTFKWLPTYKQISDIMVAMVEMEKINKETLLSQKMKE